MQENFDWEMILYLGSIEKGVCVIFRDCGIRDLELGIWYLGCGIRFLSPLDLYCRILDCRISGLSFRILGFGIWDSVRWENDS